MSGFHGNCSKDGEAGCENPAKTGFVDAKARRRWTSRVKRGGSKNQGAQAFTGIDVLRLEWMRFGYLILRVCRGVSTWLRGQYQSQVLGIL